MYMCVDVVSHIVKGRVISVVLVRGSPLLVKYIATIVATRSYGSSLDVRLNMMGMVCGVPPPPTLLRTIVDSLTANGAATAILTVT